MRVMFIVNPAAGRGRGRQVWKKVERYLLCNDLPYGVTFSRKPGEPYRLAQEACQQEWDIVAAVGGDGTVNEVANAIMGKGKILGIVPAGTGSDYSRSLPVPSNTEAATAALYTGEPLAVDVGMVNGRYFLGVAGMGFDAEVCQLVNTKLTWLKGKAAYIAGVVLTLATFRPQRVRVTLDDRVFETTATLIAVANARFFGGGMEIAPMADPTDGWFHVCVVDRLPKGEMLRVFPKIFAGKHVYHRAFAAYRAQRVSITGLEGIPIQAEGEVVGTLPLEARLIPKALTVMVAG